MRKDLRLAVSLLVDPSTVATNQLIAVIRHLVLELLPVRIPIGMIWPMHSSLWLTIRNNHRGARVDTDTPIYQLYDKELWEDFTFKERYAGWQELRRYFDHVDKKWNLRQHFEFVIRHLSTVFSQRLTTSHRFNKNVDKATFDENQKKWFVECSDGSETWCRWFIPCLGFAARKYLPPYPGFSNFKGEVYHTGVWPQYGVNLKGKKIAQIGTGASGIQVIQEIGDAAKELTIYQRTPNFCLPMNQVKLNPEEEQKKKDNGEYEDKMKLTRDTFAGFYYDFMTKNSKFPAHNRC